MIQARALKSFNTKRADGLTKMERAGKRNLVTCTDAELVDVQRTFLIKPVQVGSVARPTQRLERVYQVETFHLQGTFPVTAIVIVFDGVALVTRAVEANLAEIKNSAGVQRFAAPHALGHSGHLQLDRKDRLKHSCCDL
jgi:hypothetical protein